MRTAGLVLAMAVLALGLRGEAEPVQDAQFQMDFSHPKLSPSHWTLTLHPDGSGHFRSEQGAAPVEGSLEAAVPDVDRDIQVSAEFAGRVFETARSRKLFNDPCESHYKIAFQGWKKLSYTGPDGKGSCEFNYSKDKEIQSLGDALVSVAATILEGARLEMLLQHDRLGLDKEMEYLVEASKDGRAQQICTIRSILVRLAEDPEVMERVRKRARALLARAET